jgi:hypothetical protein
MKFGNITFGQIKNVRKSGDEENVYFADVEFSEAEGFPMETHIYCARSDDYAMTGRWVYQQIIEGNIVGSIKQIEAGIDPVTEKPYPPQLNQPQTQGSQNL